MHKAISSQERLKKSVGLIVGSSLSAFILLSTLILWLSQDSFTTSTWIVASFLLVSILVTGTYAYRSITKMFYAGQRLLQNDAKNKAILKDASDGIVTLKQDWTILSYNRTAEKLFQYEFKEIRSKNIGMLLSNPSEVYNEGLEKIQHTSKNQKVTCQRKDGTLFPAHLSITEVHVNDTKIWTGVFRDLTEEIQQQKEIENRTVEIERQTWVKTSVSQVYDSIKGVQDITALTTILSGVISKLLKASVGTFYLAEHLFEDDSDELKLYGSYAFKNTKELPVSLKIGEGLAGQCALEGEILYLNEIPEDYLGINSSCGKTPPNEIAIIPIKHNKEVIGVMEFGTVDKFNEAQHEFITEIFSSIGIIIKGVVERVKTEELSVEVNNQISAINRSNAAIEFDLDGHVLTANDLFLDLMGFTLEEIKGKHHKIFVGNNYAKSEEYKNFWKELKNGKFEQGEFERRRKDRQPVWIQGSYNPILAPCGSPYKILKIAVDITEQKQIQFEVQKQKEIVEAQEEELRVSNEELTKQANQLQASEEELRQQQEELEKANVLLEEKAQQLEEQHLDMVEKNAALEQAQAALVIKTEELEKSGKYKSEFLANMSHELRTPLNSVIILSKLLKDNKSDNLTDKQIEFAQIINKSGEDLLSLINEVLDLAKVESGKIELEIETQDLFGYAEESKKAFMAIAEDKGVNFVLNVDNSLPKTFVTDKQRLNQVIKNLLSNAFKFTGQKGTVTLDFKNSKTLPKFTNPSLLKNESVLQISVTDTGIGIAPEKLSSIFEAFVQEDGTTQRKYGGTGLGLSISKELVKLLGGEIFVESELEKGSTFTLYVPFDSSEAIQQEHKVENEMETEETTDSKKESTSQVEETKTDSNPKGKKLEAVIADDRDQLKKDDTILLVVEDDLQFAKVLLDQARENGFKVLVTDQGDKALEHVEEYHPSAIILDMQLPVMDGWTVLKKLKASEEHAHIPVHIMSGVDKTKLGLEMGAVEYLIKPIALETLEHTFSMISKKTDGADVKKVLIIEDDESNNQALQEMVKSKSLEAVAAKNAKDARKLFKNEQPDLVVLDLGLPDVDGIELLSELKTQKKETPVIVFTGRELTKKELKQIERHKDTSVVLKTNKSYDRLSEETELFLNMLNSTQTEYPVLPPKEFNSEDIIKGKRILIVDDDMRNIYALETVLEAEQVQVTVATNGAEAVEEVQNGEFDAVLMDIMMPVMDGYEATKKIRDMGNTKLPIIALTAKAMKGDREKCLEAGVSDYMSKPLDVEKLLSLLKVWLYN
ncbi:response regulator [Flagellimonas onchidii]|uniref:response regulator n=1 Tax=Flagellimonas onchidii TaxID=2562684 RepID=UPI0010A65A07|nr:response regulator [Allomuricauda onchidii]